MESVVRSMKLDVFLFAGLRCTNEQLCCSGQNEFKLDVPADTTVRQLRDLLGIDPAVPLLVMVNNHHEREDWVLQDADRVAMFPPIGGG